MSKLSMESIAEQLKAEPVLKNLYYVVKTDIIYVFGQYRYLGSIAVFDEDTYRFKFGIRDLLPKATQLRDYVIGSLKDDRPPKPIKDPIEEYTSFDLVQSPLYNQLYPILAEEVSFIRLHKGYGPINFDLRNPSNMAHKVLRHWENCAIERKMRAAFAGSWLAIPIRAAIID